MCQLGQSITRTRNTHTSSIFFENDFSKKGFYSILLSWYLEENMFTQGCNVKQWGGRGHMIEGLYRQGEVMVYR
jgi:hypothetical protein